jgi:3-keto-disaccharide hydrolase
MIHNRAVSVSAILAYALLTHVGSLPLIADESRPDIPRHGKAIVLFNGTNLDSFDSFLKTKGLNNDPDHVFRLENKTIHISGSEFGYLITRRGFSNYYLRAEFKWGEATHAPREGKARDSGILYHIQGEQKVWPTSIEFQICEGQTGYFYMTDGWRCSYWQRREARDWSTWLSRQNYPLQCGSFAGCYGIPQS